MSTSDFTLVKCWSQRLYDSFQKHINSHQDHYSRKSLARRFYSVIQDTCDQQIGNRVKSLMDEGKYLIFEIRKIGPLEDREGDNNMFKLQMLAVEMGCADNVGENRSSTPDWLLCTNGRLSQFFSSDPEQFQVGDYLVIWGSIVNKETKSILLNDHPERPRLPDTVMASYRHIRHDDRHLDNYFSITRSSPTTIAQVISSKQASSNGILLKYSSPKGIIISSQLSTPGRTPIPSSNLSTPRRTPIPSSQHSPAKGTRSRTLSSPNTPTNILEGSNISSSIPVVQLLSQESIVLDLETQNFDAAGANGNGINGNESEEDVVQISSSESSEDSDHINQAVQNGIIMEDHDYDHFQYDIRRVRKSASNRNRSDMSTRISVPNLEGGFLRTRLDETGLEEEGNTSTAPLVPTHRSDEWHPGRRPSLRKNNEYNYKTLATLEKELIDNGGVHQMLKRQTNVYGVVDGLVNSPEAGSIRLRIFDDSGKQNVLVRICITHNEIAVGPKPHKNDIIRVHRACVQMEAKEMVISTAPHHNVTLFNYTDDLTAEIEVATVALTTSFRETDKQRIIELRTFIKQRLESNMEDDDEEELERQDDDRMEEGNNEGQEGLRLDNGTVHGRMDESINEDDDDEIHENTYLSDSSCGILSTEFRTQSQGYGEPVIMQSSYELDESIVDEVLNSEENSTLLEELSEGQNVFNGRFWIRGSIYDAALDCLIVRVTDGTESTYNSFETILNADDEKVEIISCDHVVGSDSEEESIKVVPTVDIVIMNAGENEEVITVLMRAEGNRRDRYILRGIEIREESGTTDSRGRKNAKLVIDGLDTSIKKYEEQDKFTGLRILSESEKTTTSNSPAKTPVNPPSRRSGFIGRLLSSVSSLKKNLV